jgi:adenosylcobinamide kinase/adenosylcobinamide-phosphate guanylyltransferase
MGADLLARQGLLLISGPSRGGKSRWAEHLAAGWTGPVLYLATGPGESSDPSWCERVASHRQRRPAHWQCMEVGAGLETQLLRLAPVGATPPEVAPCLLIESLGTWIAWHLEEAEADWTQRCDTLIAALLAQPGPVLMVVEETGWGVVPPTAVGVLFRDRLGALQQRLMQHSVGAWLVVAGRALNLFELGLAVPHP